MKSVLLIIPPDRFRDEELFETKQVLEKKGFQTQIASSRTGYCVGTKGGFARARIALSAVDVRDYEAVLFIGGSGSKLLFENEHALRIARDAYSLGKIVGAICLASVILANAGVLKGKLATVTDSDIRTIQSKGAIYSSEDVTVDGTLVTANGPEVASLFGEKIVELLQHVHA